MAADSIPVKLLHEAEGHIVSLQTVTGEMFRGKLVEAEDNMNCLLKGTTVTYANGKEIQMENVYIRGSKVVMLILPDMFKNAPMFRRGRGRGGGRGFPRGGGGRGAPGMQRGRGGGRGHGGGYAPRGGYSRGTGYQSAASNPYNLYPSTSQWRGGSSGGGFWQ